MAGKEGEDNGGMRIRKQDYFGYRFQSGGINKQTAGRQASSLAVALPPMMDNDQCYNNFLAKTPNAQAHDPEVLFCVASGRGKTNTDGGARARRRRQAWTTWRHSSSSSLPYPSHISC